jgi:hypothetical protein
VALSHIVVLTAALLALLSLPCALVAVVHSDEPNPKRGRRGRSDTNVRLLRRLDRSLSCPATALTCDQTPLDDERLPAIEQIAAELRRLDRQRHSGPTAESVAWLTAVVGAYDRWLRLACRRLDVAEHLQGLEGVDRDIERVRVEGELQAAGLALRSAAHRPPQ